MSVARYIRARAERLGGEARLSGDHLSLSLASGREMQLKVPDKWSGDLTDFHHALPGRARGDQRERLISAIAEDAVTGAGHHDDSELWRALADPGRLPVSDERERNVLAGVMQEHYWVRPEATGRGMPKRFAFPFHAAIPANFPPKGQYKMFRSDILLFLCWDGSDIDARPLEALCKLLSDDEDFTLLDELLVDLVLDLAGKDAPERVEASQLLASNQAAKVRGYLASGAFLQPSLDRFREDFMAALAMPLPRHDRVEAAILTLSLHLGLYYYEIGYLLGTGLDAVTRKAAGLAEELSLPFKGRLRFRVGTAGDRPVRQADGCAVAWRELDDHYLISFLPNVITANLLHNCWSAAAADVTSNPDPAALAVALAADPELAELIDAAAGSLALLYADKEASASAPGLARLEMSEEPGVHLLRSVIHGHLRGSLHYRSRAVVNQLIKRRFGGSLIRRRGRVFFFELDEDLLFLLVRFVLSRSPELELPFREFLEGLAQYGLAPQDRNEEEMLAAALERLGMLHRYSDAGEAMYVRHPL